MLLQSTSSNTLGLSTILQLINVAVFIIFIIILIQLLRSRKFQKFAEDMEIEEVSAGTSGFSFTLKKKPIQRITDTTVTSDADESKHAEASAPPRSDAEVRHRIDTAIAKSIISTEKGNVVTDTELLETLEELVRVHDEVLVPRAREQREQYENLYDEYLLKAYQSRSWLDKLMYYPDVSAYSMIAKAVARERTGFDETMSNLREIESRIDQIARQIALRQLRRHYNQTNRGEQDDERTRGS